MLRFSFTRDPETTPIDQQVTNVLERMEAIGVDDEEYPKLLEHLTKLYEVKRKERRSPISSDTLAIVIGNFAVAALIVIYEQKHVMTSKGLNQMIRLSKGS